MPRLPIAALAALTATTMAAAQKPNTLSADEQKTGWTLLFDGKSLAGWHGYGNKEAPAGWRVVDGELTRIGVAGDLVTDRKYRNFELAIEWKIPAGGNSGILYRGVESGDPQKNPLYYSAPEMQVLDDAGHPDGKSPLTSAGSDYGLYPAPRGVVKPAGQWNSARVLVNGNHVEHWLNGQKVVEYELGSPDWTERVKGSKFAAWAGYGKAAEGVIGLQDHGARVAFRNIKIRVLP